MLYDCAAKNMIILIDTPTVVVNNNYKGFHRQAGGGACIVFCMASICTEMSEATQSPPYTCIDLIVQNSLIAPGTHFFEFYILTSVTLTYHDHQ